MDKDVVCIDDDENIPGHVEIGRRSLMVRPHQSQ